jgi:hypothetical protein
MLNAKFVYKRKYHILPNGSEQFLKWKSHMTVVGCVERQGWETVYSTFSPRDRDVYIKLPDDAGVHVGKILLLKSLCMG